MDKGFADGRRFVPAAANCCQFPLLFRPQPLPSKFDLFLVRFFSVAVKSALLYAFPRLRLSADDLEKTQIPF
jgi:hypothetical protein